MKLAHSELKVWMERAKETRQDLVLFLMLAEADPQISDAKVGALADGLYLSDRLVGNLFKFSHLPHFYWDGFVKQYPEDIAQIHEDPSYLRTFVRHMEDFIEKITGPEPLWVD